MLSKRLSIIVATAGMVLIVWAVIGVRVFWLGPILVRLSMGVALALSVVLFVAILGNARAVWRIWVPLGAVWGFAILGVWSIGLFLARGATVLLIASAIHLIGQRNRRAVVRALVSFLIGASAVCVWLFVVGTVWQTWNGYTITSQSLILGWGSAICLVLLVALTVFRSALGNDRSRSRV